MSLTLKYWGRGMREVNDFLCHSYDSFFWAIIRSVFLNYLDVSVYIPNQEEL
jgi:hypothetical protein